MKKLVIFDFDGVIADTEKLWVSVWHKFVNENSNLNWSFEEAYKNFAGVSPVTKIERLKNFGINVTESDYAKIIEGETSLIKEIEITKDIIDILKDENLIKCIGTGGPTLKTAKKIDVLNIRKYLPNEIVFTAEMVKRGKPEPDIFLYAAEKMGYKPEDCVVVEDSIAGAIAAKAAKMDIIAFTEHQHIDRDNYLKKLKEIGVTKFANNVKELKKYIY
ncbi:MAG: HAD family phosphatase [Alphaproteobacteria bacterium]|nr:HAD family phosphatase [Alphaproteobacteria bacterium]